MIKKKRNETDSQPGFGFPIKRSSWSGKIPPRKLSSSSDSDESPASSPKPKKKMPHLLEKIFRKNSKEDANSPSPKVSRKFIGVGEQTEHVIKQSA